MELSPTPTTPAEALPSSPTPQPQKQLEPLKRWREQRSTASTSRSTSPSPRAKQALGEPELEVVEEEDRSPLKDASCLFTESAKKLPMKICRESSRRMAQSPTPSIPAVALPSSLSPPQLKPLRLKTLSTNLKFWAGLSPSMWLSPRRLELEMLEDVVVDEEEVVEEGEELPEEEEVAGEECQLVPEEEEVEETRKCPSTTKITYFFFSPTYFSVKNI